MSAPLLTVAIASTQRKWYGGEEQIRLLAEGLRDRGHAVHLLAARGGELARRLGAAGFAVAEFVGNGRNPLGLWQLRRHLKRIRPDVLQYNDSHALSAAGLASIGLGIPARIAMRHVSLPVRSPRRFSWLADCVVCVSQAVADVCRRDGLPGELLRVVYPAGDPQSVLAGDRLRGREAVGVNDQQLLLLVVASLNRHKGHAVLFEALPRVLHRYPQAQVILAGDGPERSALARQSRQLGIDGSLRFLGYRRDVPDLLRAADLVVLPSLAGEGLPVTLIDAMLAGVPWVSTSAGGTPELAAAEPPGSEPAAWVVPVQRPDALAEAILDALDHPDRRARRAALARERAERRFTPPCLVDGMLAVYEEVLDAAARRSL